MTSTSSRLRQHAKQLAQQSLYLKHLGDIHKGIAWDLRKWALAQFKQAQDLKQKGA